ncbi:MAG: DUF1549 domain-containing protein [bacterium]
MIRSTLSSRSRPASKSFLAFVVCPVLLAVSIGADEAKKAAKKAEKKPGNAVVNKQDGKERKTLAKALESEGKSAEEVKKLVDVITPADRREALRTIQAIQNFVKAVGDAEQKTKNEGPGVEAILAARPKKVVEPTTFSAADLDRLMKESLQKAGVKSADLTDDETFLRRVSLDLTGVLPSPEMLETFQKSTDPSKRVKTIARLVKAPGFAAAQAKYWRDVIRFRATETQQKRFQPQVLEKYFTEKFAANTPWDEIAREMITAMGPIDDNPAVLLTTAQESKSEETAGEVSRVFMGIQIQCAQCHDHPTDSWKRQQFQQFAAFFSGVRTANFSGNAVAAGQRVFGPKAVGQVVHQVANPKDPTDMQQFSPKFFLNKSAGDLPLNVSVEGRRAVAASYIAAQDNPWFAKAFINRAWYQLMGDAFYMPVDDIGPEREGKNLEVLDALATAWTKRGYDIAWLYETIATSQTYQRQSRQPSGESTEAEISGANCPTRLRADQLLQNLRMVTGTPILGVKPVENARGPRAQMAKAKAAGGAAPIQGPLAKAVIRAVQTFSFDPSTPDEDVVGTIPQALFMMNAPDLNRAVEARDGSVLSTILDEHPKDDKAALSAIYKRVLARDPNAEEVKIATDYIAEVGKRGEAFEDLFWSLLNSAEFLSRR